MMVASRGRDHNSSGLGRAIINRKIKDAKQGKESGLFSAEPDSSKRLISVTQERDLDDFLHTAELAGTDFTAEKRNIKILPQNIAALKKSSPVEEKETLLSQLENKQRLRVPRRPSWTKSVSPAELDRKERATFLDWRRGLAELQDRDKFLLTPFERNLEVWRQLWRVLERSHIVVQIVDARNPLRFRCEDLETYITEIEGTEGEKGTGKGNRRNMLLINKADLLTLEQRIEWADYFDAQGLQYAFYSAASVAAIQDVRRAAEELSRSGGAVHDEPAVEAQVTRRHGRKHVVQSKSDDDESDEEYYSADEWDDSTGDPRGKILSAAELELMFAKNAPDLSEFFDSSENAPSKVVVGLVGYPNVGKSSTINSLLGEKKVSVSSTPGKTKHFQTIDLSESIMLCDCPGLVFPQFASTKADLVCDGVLPIDQLREYTGPVSLVTNRIPKEILEATYGLTIRTVGIEDGGDNTVSSEGLLIAYAIGRGFMRSGQGNPDEARAARYVLKDYVDGKLLYCHPPPGFPETEFNRPTHKNAALRLIGKKHAPITRVGKSAATFVPISNLGPAATDLEETRSNAIDNSFFDLAFITRHSRPLVQQSGKEFSRSMLYPHQSTVAADGTAVDPRQARLLSLLENVDKDKKHRTMKRVKQRSGRGYDV